MLTAETVTEDGLGAADPPGQLFSFSGKCFSVCPSKFHIVSKHGELEPWRDRLQGARKRDGERRSCSLLHEAARWRRKRE